MAKLGQGNVRQGMAEGVSNLTAVPKGWQNVGTLKLGTEWLRALLIYLLCPQDGKTGAGYSEARYG